MRLTVEGRNLILLMRDGSYFEVGCPTSEIAAQLKGVLELGIADTIEQIQIEGVPDLAGPIR